MIPFSLSINNYCLSVVKKTSKSKRKKAERQQRDTIQEIINKVNDSWVIEHARQVSP